MWIVIVSIVWIYKRNESTIHVSEQIIYILNCKDLQIICINQLSGAVWQYYMTSVGSPMEWKFEQMTIIIACACVLVCVRTSQFDTTGQLSVNSLFMCLMDRVRFCRRASRVFPPSCRQSTTFLVGLERPNSGAECSDRCIADIKMNVTWPLCEHCIYLATYVGAG
jgi:hypothetical protein